MRIDKQGITTEEKGTIHWNRIKRCFYISFPTTQWQPKSFLEIVLKNDEHISILLNEYSCNGRKLFGRIAQDDKDELKGLLTGFAFVLVFILFVMLLVYMNNSSN